MTLETFVLVGTILSYDSFFATVEFNTNPAVNGGPAVAVLPKLSIPCEIENGKTIYVVKNENEEHSRIVCKKDN